MRFRAISLVACLFVTFHSATLAQQAGPNANDFLTTATSLKGPVEKVDLWPVFPVADMMHQDHCDPAEGQTGTMMEQCEPAPEAVRMFQERCIFCHGSVADLVNSRLILKDEKLFGRYSEREISVFLTTHGRLVPSQVPMMVDLLKWQLTQQ